MRRFLLGPQGWPYLLVPFIPAAVVLEFADAPAGAIFIVAALAGYACQQLRDESKSAGTDSQREANDKLTDVRAKADVKVAEAHQEVVKATDEANQATAQAQANANDKVREENRAVADTHDQTRKWAQEKMDDVDHRIDAARTKAQTAAPTAMPTPKESAAAPHAYPGG